MSSDPLLTTLPLLILDCQATGPNPSKGQMIDVAWLLCSAEQPEDQDQVRSSLVALEQGQKLRRRVSELTGISSKMLKGAPELDKVWERLMADLDTLGHPVIPLVHYARYEKPFFVDKLGPHPHVAWDKFICTHDIARRMFPGLPRRGLRAMAGYLGAHLPAQKRSQVHVQGTAFIWRELVMLFEEEGVERWSEFVDWMENSSTKRAKKRQFAVSAQTRLALPQTPGVYRFLSRHRDVLYVGKATSLKQRVNSYYRGKKGQGEQKLEMVTRAWHIDVTETATQLEACLLESDQIKQHAPPYNQMLQDSGRIVGFTPSLLEGEWLEQPDHDRLCGPFGRPSLINQLRLMRSLVLGECSLEEGVRLFWRLGDADLLAKGLALWKSTYANEAILSFSEDAVREHGKRLWEAWLAKRAEEAASTGEPEEDASSSGSAVEAASSASWQWTPEGIAKEMDRIVKGATHHERRGEFLARLLDATLVWQPLHDEEAPLRALCLRRGQVEQVCDLEAGVTGMPRAWHEAHTSLVPSGLGAFDVTTYDRLSVLTGQLHRLVKLSQVVHLWQAGEDLAQGKEALARDLVWL